MFLVLSFISFSILAAHTLRTGDLGLCLALVSLFCMTFSRQAWVRIVQSAVLICGVFFWGQTTKSLVLMRIAFSDPWQRLALILGAVIAATIISVLCMQGDRARQFFSKNTETRFSQAGAFIFTVLILGIARFQVNFSILLLDRYLPGLGWLQILALAIYAAWLTRAMASPINHTRLRPRIWALFSLVFFIQLGLGLLGMKNMLMTGNLHLPVPALIVGGPLFRGSGYFMPILFASSVLLVGPAWCSHLCYIGAWDDLLSRRSIQKQPANIGNFTIWGRLATLLMTIGMALGLRYTGVDGVTAIWIAAVFGLLGVGVMVFFSRRIGVMAHCSAYCPIGLVGNLLGRLSPWRMRMADSCTKCGRCSRHCRYGALEPRHIKAGYPGLSCTLCGDCVSACEATGHLAMRYSCLGLSSATLRMAFVAIVAALHASFLGVARI